MVEEQPAMLKLISRAVSIATRAGTEVRRIAESGQLGVVDKGVEDFQTEADRLVQRMIVGSLKKHFPKITIIAEEDLTEDEKTDASLLVDNFDEEVLKKHPQMPAELQSAKEDELVVWIDPLDGTSEFVKGTLEPVTILIGISLKRRSIAGVINQPFYKGPDGLMGRTIWGCPGVGISGIKKVPPPEDRFIITTSSSHGNTTNEDAISHLKPQEVVKVGGAGFKILMLIEGKAHTYLFASRGCKRWDTCAPEALLKSVSGELTDICGNSISYEIFENRDYSNFMGVLAAWDAKTHFQCREAMLLGVKENLSKYRDSKL